MGAGTDFEKLKIQAKTVYLLTNIKLSNKHAIR
jgi:hypothetical protein